MSAAEDALGLARAGLPVFPCGAGKAPLVAGGFLAATADLAPGAALVAPLAARPAGRADRRTFALVGARPRHRPAHRRDDRRGHRRRGSGSMPPRHVVTTRSGGAHWIYAGARTCRGARPAAFAGVDTGRSGGYVVAWQPAVLIAAKADRACHIPRGAAARARAAGPAGRRPRLHRAAELLALGRGGDGGRAAAVATAPEGSRNHQLNRSAFRLGQLAAGGDLDLEESPPR